MLALAGREVIVLEAAEQCGRGMVNFKKAFRRGAHSLIGQVDLFNVLNSGGILTQTNTVGSSLGQPLTIRITPSTSAIPTETATV